MTNHRFLFKSAQNEVVIFRHICETHVFYYWKSRCFGSFLTPKTINTQYNKKRIRASSFFCFFMCFELRFDVFRNTLKNNMLSKFFGVVKYYQELPLARVMLAKPNFLYRNLRIFDIVQNCMFLSFLNYEKWFSKILWAAHAF